jgi:hypothetical protein
MSWQPRGVTIAIVYLLWAASGWAMRAPAADDPFGGPPPAADALGAAKPAAEPVGAPAKAGPAAKPKAEPLVPAVEEQNPVVLAIRDMKPSTPKDLAFAVRSLFDIGRTDEAKGYLQKLIEAKPDRDQLEAMYREYGGDFFLRLARDPNLQPEGAQFHQMALNAAYEASRDPARLDRLVKELSDPSPVVHRHAVEELQRAGEAAAAPLLAALADGGRASEHPRIRDGVLAIGNSMIEPLLGASETPDEALRVQVIELLGRFGTPRAVPLLVAPSLRSDVPEPVQKAAAAALRRIVRSTPTRYEATQYLYRRAQEHLDGALAGRLDHEDQITLWRWDVAAKTSVPQSYSEREAARMLAARLARELYLLAPDDLSYRRLYLVANLTAAKIETGWDRPLPRGAGTVAAAALALGQGPIEDALVHAMQRDYVAAAVAAAELLPDVGGEELLLAEDGHPRPLALALRHSDRRLRLAAAEAILKIDTEQSYPGSSYLPETLGYFIRTVGSRRALVAHPRVDQSQTLIGMLHQIGIEADAVRTGRETVRLALRHPDYEFALISDAVDFPNANETIQMLRKDAYTSRLTIGLIAREENLKKAQDIAEHDPLVEAFPRPHDDRTMAFQARRLLELAGHHLVTYDQRLDQAERALDQLLRLAELPQKYAFYDLHRQQAAIESALATAQLSVKAARLLGLLGSPEAQRALVTLASQHARPLAERQAAAQGFGVAVERHGLLLTRDDIRVQYERYNQSETLDAGTQKVLGEVLDAIERPSRQAAGQTPGVPPNQRPRNNQQTHSQEDDAGAARNL